MKRTAPSLTQQTLGGLLWMSYGKFAHALLHLAVLAILARLLTPAEFGVVSAALIVIGLSSIVSQVGLGPALVQRHTLERRHIDTAFIASVALGMLLGAAMWVGAPLAARFFRIAAVEPVLRGLAWLFPLQGLATAAHSLMKREFRFRWLANLEVISYGVGFGGVGIVTALLGMGVWALVVANLAQSAVKTGMLLASRPPRLASKPEWRAFKELMYFGGGFTVAKIANQVAQQGDYLVVGRFLGPAALGYYGRAYNLMSAPASGFGKILDSVLFPIMARVQNERHRLAAAYRRGVALIAVMVVPSSAALILLAPEVVHVVLGPHWTAVVVPFQILAAGMLFRTSSKLADALTRATGAVYRRAWRQILYATLVVGGAVIGQRWGIAGVAWFVLLALSVNFAQMAQLSLSEAKMSWSSFWRVQLPAFLIAGVSTPLVWLLVTAFRQWGVVPVATLASGLAVTGACGVLLMYISPTAFMGDDGRWMIATIRSFAGRQSRGRSAAALAATPEGGRPIPAEPSHALEPTAPAPPYEEHLP